MVKTSTVLLRQISELIQKLETHEYTRELSILNGNTIGKHIRHILEFYQCLIQAHDSSTLNYDERKRDLTIETSIDKAQSVIEEIISEIRNLDLKKEIDLKQGLFDAEIYIKSSIEREFLYNIEHTVHHLAIVRIAIEQSFEHISLPQDFGVAFSTKNYRESFQN